MQPNNMERWHPIELSLERNNSLRANAPTFFDSCGSYIYIAIITCFDGCRPADPRHQHVFVTLCASLLRIPTSDVGDTFVRQLYTTCLAALCIVWNVRKSLKTENHSNCLCIQRRHTHVLLLHNIPFDIDCLSGWIHHVRRQSMRKILLLSHRRITSSFIFDYSRSCSYTTASAGKLFWWTLLLFGSA
jgi:hypothetical protein